jgi:pimeloyl-ACP methyl ester carboxylesterase
MVREREFRLPSVTLTALEWGDPKGIPVLATHGWLDNAASYLLLAPLLPGCHFVAFDAAGHGFSSNRSPDSAYNIWQEVGDIYDVAEQLGWQRFNLLGHSRGATSASMFAGSFPARVQRLMLIEGGVPIAGKAADAPAGLGEAIVQSRALRSKAGRIFSDREQAVRERANGFSPVTLEAAEILASRSLREVPGGWQWHADQRLKARSDLRLTAELARAFLAAIEAPTLMFLAEESPFANRSSFSSMLQHVSRLEVCRLAGRHHLHMEGKQSDIAQRLMAFLSGS